MSARFPKPRLPGIMAIIGIAGVVWLGPLALSAEHELEEVNEWVEGADAATEAAHTLEILLRLSPATSFERNATAGKIGMAFLPPEAPAPVLASMGLDYGPQLVRAKEVTDGLLVALGDVELSELLAEAREVAAVDSVPVVEVVTAYELVADALADRVNEQMTVLAAAVGSSPGGPGLVHAARVAETAAEIQVLSSENLNLWAPLVVPMSQPTIGDVLLLSDNFAQLHGATDRLEHHLVEGHATEAAWRGYLSLEATSALHERFHDTIVDLLATGLPVDDPGGPLEFSELDFDEVMATVAWVGETMALDAEAAAQLNLVTESAFVEVAESEAAVSASAAAARSNALAVFFGLAAILIGLGFLVAKSIAAPVRAMASAARALRDGKLDEHVDERGPRELRVAARVMNEATASLRLAERQAVALATENLEDPVLDEEAQGELGASLQKAVVRLTDALTERERFQRRLAHEAAHDNLTTLPNRKAVLKHVSSALARTRRSSASLALLFLDLDGFKAINDTHGHHIGDSVLRILARRLLDTVREGDLAGRLGGDEFLVVAEPILGIDDAIELSERIIAELSEPVNIDELTVSVTVSVGIAMGDTDLTADELLRDADLAVYRAKELGRGRIEVCDEDLRGQVVERATLAQAIGEALDNDEFVLHFQPTVDSRTQEVNSLEALVRWDRPGEGLVPPGAFIEVAERSNLIVDIDRWVLRAAVAQIAEWSDHPLLGRLPVSVNISGRHLSTGTLVDEVSALLRGHGVAPEKLTLEITETALVNDLAAAARDLAWLRAHGVRIALDDFGTGYMSLAHLRGLPVDVLKIDRSFVAEMDTVTDHSLIELIVATGHLLGISITAEGVETLDQQEQLVAIGSDTLQGFLFSRPVDSDRLRAMLEETGGRIPTEAITPR